MLLIQKTRIPKRVLHFPDDDDLTENIPLKDSSSRMNVLDPPESREEIVARLQRRKKELEEVTRAAALELEGIDKQLCLLRLDEGVQTTAMDNLSLERDTGSETGSPFANVGSSPTAAAPLELLSRDFAKRPENIYKVFRQSCSFLKTPQPSAFRKDTSLQRFQQTSQYSGDETPNISRRLQKQLADLFDEWFFRPIYTSWYITERSSYIFLIVSSLPARNCKILWFLTPEVFLFHILSLSEENTTNLNVICRH